ncbi:cytochrome P450 [Fimicolochytrium jonesii]|uniref:cytochrome P450 n=1 Tax=Fimicolochytrium jonesii TaxID=1396493 RepID=UPI0022FE8343|nr:cytochrome P450 [Fimicolochytrium jonesii]KAI8818462.1 cytochrome P450 [Fimicolochytrium jonesii]
MSLLDPLSEYKLIVPIAALLLAYLLHHVVFSSKRNPTLPTPKGSLPIVGCTFQALHILKDQTLSEFLNKQQDDLGPLWNLNTFGVYTPIISDPATAKRVMTETSTFVRDDTFEIAATGVLRYGLFLIPSGDLWKKHRKLLQPAFSPSHLRLGAKVSVENTDNLLSTWRKHLSVGNTESNDRHIVINLHQHLSGLALDIIGQVALGGRPFGSVGNLPIKNARGESSGEIPQSFIAFEQIMKTIGSRFGLPLWAWKLLKLENDQAQDGIQYAHNLAARVVKERREALNADGRQRKDQKDLDVLDRVIMSGDAGDADGSMSDAEIRDEILGFMLAGHETTSNALTSIMVHLMQNPRVYAKLQSEIKAALPDNQIPTYDTNLPYANYVVKEGLRLSPAVRLLMRTSTKPVTVLDHHFQAGTNFTVNVYHMQKSKAIWGQDAEQFVPERWEDSEKVKEVEASGAYLPFGAGPMMCIGQKLAVLEMKMVLIRCLQSFDFELVPGQDLRFTVDDITCGFKRGVYVNVKERLVQ